MRFWDTSALVPLLVEQPTSRRAAAWFSEDGVLAIWTLTSVEIVSGLRRLVREQTIDEHQAREAESRVDQLVAGSYVVVDVEATKSTARRLLRLHPLRAFDALQLGAALQWAAGQPERHVVHTFDQRLGLAAQREGFVVPA